MGLFSSLFGTKTQPDDEHFSIDVNCKTDFGFKNWFDGFTATITGPAPSQTQAKTILEHMGHLSADSKLKSWLGGWAKNAWEDKKIDAQEWTKLKAFVAGIDTTSSDAAAELAALIKSAQQKQGGFSVVVPPGREKEVLAELARRMGENERNRRG